jgi:hypothetical protein
MQYSNSKVHCITWANSLHFSVDRYFSITRNDEPVFSAFFVALIRKALAGIYPDTFNFMS